MLSDARGSVVVSSLGWVDQGHLWVFRPSTGAATQTRLGEAKYLSLHAGEDNYFSVAHHTESARIAITVHNLAHPEAVLASAIVDEDANRVIGDVSVWSRVPVYYTTFYMGQGLRDYVLVRVDPRVGRVDVHAFDWFTHDDYDLAYQGIVGVTAVPGDETVLVSVQRSSRIVIYDPVARRQRGGFDLAGNRGNPTLYFRRRANELWADDYDAIVKVEPGTWRVLKSRRLQDMLASVGQFIGHFAFDAEEALCVVARPYSQDVVAIDPASLRTQARCRMSGQPLDAVALPDRSVVARDWKTGRLLRGELTEVGWLG